MHRRLAVRGLPMDVPRISALADPSHPLSHRLFALDVDGVRLVNHAIDDGVGYRPVAQLGVPLCLIACCLLI